MFKKEGDLNSIKIIDFDMSQILESKNQKMTFGNDQARLEYLAPQVI